ncbi:MAG TPA: HIT family protein [Eubacteriaceae bacterium]|nr:HIT family protein [Eubacteriaceae bacterium]
MKECIFCEKKANKETVLENDLAFAVYDKYPVNEGHMLIVPKRHYENYFDSSSEELLCLNDMLCQARALLEESYQPDGYNIGINVGKDAGQTIDHLHIHLIPRYEGDVENPAGGVRRLKEQLVHYDG